MLAQKKCLSFINMLYEVKRKWRGGRKERMKEREKLRGEGEKKE